MSSKTLSGEWTELTPAKLTLKLIRAYQYVISPLLPPTCRFYPTCSEYSYQAVEKYGLIRGCCLTLWRLLRCHPFHPGGYDPLR
ncbi:MAG: membrane protein insertion efficiency factor YidD [Deltaproteobacteria bacterium]|nr:membrane protein insertion efficiency factor YidD [Deltaproteobacteria bacterium]